MKTIFSYLALALLCLFAAVYGLGSSYNSIITPTSQGGEFDKIHHDNWIEAGASFSLAGLASRGNRAYLTFNPWRPEAAGAAIFEYSVCGSPVGGFQVGQESSRKIHLTGECEPRVVALDVKNPFQPSEQDQRQLGVKLHSLKVSSFLGVPLLNFAAILKIAGALFLLVVLIGALPLALPYRPVVLLLQFSAPLLGFVFLAITETHPLLGIQLHNIAALWSLVVALLIGAIVAGRAARLSHFEPPGAPTGSDTGISQPKFTALIITLIVLGGAALRFYNLNFGLPANLHPDEVPKVNAIMRMHNAGNLNPVYFLHPSLLLYSSYLVNTIFHALPFQAWTDWLAAASGGNLSGQGAWRETAFLAGRVVSATAGSLSIYLVYKIGARLFTPITGLLGATILAFAPLHVTCSRYMKEDALLVALTLAAILAMLKAVQDNRMKYLFLAMFLAGVSASTKYSGLLTIAIVLSAPWFSSRAWLPDRRVLKFTLLALPLAPVGFILFTPYSVLTWKKFYADFSSERKHMQRGHTTAVDAWSQVWMYHYYRSILPGFGTITTFVAAAGAGLMLWKRRIEGLFLVGIILFFYMPAEWVRAKPAPQPERYILPCLPFLALACAEFVRQLAEIRLRLAAAVLSVVVIFYPAQRSIQLASEIGSDTRVLMSEWMVENIPHGSKVVVDWKPYSPRFWNSEFEVIFPDRKSIFETLSVNRLKHSGNDYLVLSSLFYDRYFTEPGAPAALRGKIRDIFNQLPIVAKFEPKYGTYGFHNPTLVLISLKSEK